MTYPGPAKIRCGRTPPTRRSSSSIGRQQHTGHGSSGRPDSSGGKVAEVGLNQALPPPPLTGRQIWIA
jgi:hypothetical protein